MNPATYEVVAAMTLGDKTALTKETREKFNMTGASHILAISGLHLGIIYMMVSLLAWGRRWRIVAQVLTLVLLWGFAFLVGLPASVVRATTMLTIYGLLSLGYRQPASPKRCLRWGSRCLTLPCLLFCCSIPLFMV